MRFTLRDYQERGVDDIREAFRIGHRSVVFTLPTGGGKTVTFSYMAEKAAQRGKRVLVVAHRRELIDQASATFRAFDIDHGLILSGRSQNREPVQCAMVATLVRRLEKIDPPDLIIIDEAHHATAKTYQKVIDAFPSSRVLGVTATPQRTDGTGLGDVFDSIVVGPEMKDLISRGSLSPYRIFSPPQQIDVSSVKMTAGEFNSKQAAVAADRSIITGDAVKHYKELCGGQAVAFCVSVEHAEHVAQHFRDNGISAERIDGGMSAEMRASTLDRYAQGQTRVLTSVDLIGEGFDLPSIEGVILLRPTQSLIVYLQQVGRALRPSPGKEAAIILDHSGNCFRHGFPDDPRNWSLQGRKKGVRNKVGSIPVAICEVCFSAYRPTNDRCPHCGSIKDNKARTVQYQDGNLIEITPEMERHDQFQQMTYKETIEEASSVDDIKIAARARGYRPGWSIRRVMQQEGMSAHEAAVALGYNPGIVHRLRLGSGS